MENLKYSSPLMEMEAVTRETWTSGFFDLMLLASTLPS